MILGTWPPSMAQREGKKEAQQETSLFLDNINSFLTTSPDRPKPGPAGQHQYLIHNHAHPLWFLQTYSKLPVTQETFLSRRVQFGSSGLWVV